MKKFAMLTFTGLFALMLAACAQISPVTLHPQTPVLDEGMIKPGGKIGDDDSRAGRTHLAIPLPVAVLRIHARQARASNLGKRV